MDIQKHTKKHKFFYLLILVTLIGFLTRVHDLGAEKIWIDEGITAYYSQLPMYENIKWSLSAGFYPLFHIILGIWEKFFGISPFNIRFLSVIFGTLSVCVVFAIGEKLFNRKVGIYSAIIMSLSSFNVYYSQEARPYELFVLLSLLSIYFYLKYLQSTNKKHFFYYIFFTLLMLSSHGPSIFILIFQNIYHFLIVRKDIKKWIYSQAILFIFFIPLSFVVIRSILIDSQFLVIPRPTLVSFIKTFYMFSAGATDKPIALLFGGLLSAIFGLALLSAFIMIIKSIKKKNYLEFNRILFLFLWLVIPIMLLVLQAYFFYAFYWERYVIVSSVALYMIVAYSISKFKYKNQLISIFGIIVLSLSVLSIDLNTLNKENWEAVADYMKSNKMEDSAIIINVPISIYSFTYYYDQSCYNSRNLIKCTSNKNIFSAQNAENLPKTIANYGKIYLILYNSHYGDPKGSLLNYFSDKYKLKSEKRFGEIEVYIFAKYAI